MISLQRVVGFLLLKSCFIAFEKTSALPLPPGLVYCWAPMTMVSEPWILLMRSTTASRRFSFWICSASISNRSCWMGLWGEMPSTITPLLKVDMLHAIEIDKTLVDAVAEIGRRLLTDDADHPGCQLAIQLIVTGEDGDFLIGKLLCHLKIRYPLLDAQRLCLIASRHNATIIVG